MKKCPYCSEEIKDEAVKCRYCGEWLEKKEEVVSDGQSSQGDPSIEKITEPPQAPPLSKDQTAESITDEEFETFIGKNTSAYISKFKNFNVGGHDKFKATWNWPAFLVPCFWALYRKLYLWALLAFVLLLIPFAGPVAMIIFGVAGNYIYYRHAKKKIIELRGGSADLALAGGVNRDALVTAVILLVVAVGVLAAIAIPQFEHYRGESKKDYINQIEKYTKVIEVAPKDADAYFIRGNTYIILEDYNQAIADFNKVIELNPKYVRAYVDRGEAYLSIGNENQAIADFNKAIELDPKFAFAYTQRGRAYMTIDNFSIGKNSNQAIADFNKAIELDPKDAFVYASRGYTYSLLGNNIQAIRDYNKAIEMDPKDAHAYNSRGKIYSKIGDYKQAIADFSKAIELNPKSWQVYDNRGASYGKLGNLNQAIQDFNKVLEINPNHADAYINRGIIYGKLGNRNQSIEDYKIAARMGHKGAEDYLKRQGIAW